MFTRTCPVSGHNNLVGYLAHFTITKVSIVGWNLPANVRGMASSESWTIGSSAAFTSSSGTSTCRLKHTFPYMKQIQKQRGKKTWDYWSGSYIVDIMYTALLLIVLLERAVAVEFPVETWKERSITRHAVTLQTPCARNKQSRHTSWCCHQSAWGMLLCTADWDLHQPFSGGFHQTDCACSLEVKMNSIWIRTVYFVLTKQK